MSDMLEVTELITVNVDSGSNLSCSKVPNLIYPKSWLTTDSTIRGWGKA